MSSSRTETSADRCRVCGAAVREAFHSGLATSVSSSCSVVKRTARVVACTGCGLLQRTDQDLATDYEHYELFDNDPAADKVVRRPGLPDRTRGQFVADIVVQELTGNPGARVLEVGCHRGAFLAALKAEAPRFELHGFDLHPDYARWIEPLCGQGHYHHGDVANIPGSFDGCVLIHTLEHIPAPVDVLKTLRRLLGGSGCLVIVVPDIRANPADCYTADHTCHFDAGTLRSVLARAGFAGRVEEGVITNELIAVARPEEATLPLKVDVPDLSSLTVFERGLARLPHTPVYVLGTALLGALIDGRLGANCLGFADEAPFRQGKKFHDKLVRHPRELTGQTIVLGIAEKPAQAVTPRLREWGVHVVDPWVLGRSSS